MLSEKEQELARIAELIGKDLQSLLVTRSGEFLSDYPPSDQLDTLLSASLQPVLFLLALQRLQRPAQLTRVEELLKKVTDTLERQLTP